jgi:hypothetical protein
MLMIGWLAGGCAAGGALLYKLSPAPTIPAEYKPAKEPTVVFVENYQNPDLVQVQADRLAREVSQELSDHKVVPVVAPEKLAELRTTKGELFHSMNLPAVGQSLGARQVIYVDLSQFAVDLQPGSEMIKGKASAMVKLIDVQTGHTLWPRDSSGGRQLKVETPYVRPGDGVSPDLLQEEMFHTLGDRIAKLFYDWQSDQVDGTEPSEPVR